MDPWRNRLLKDGVEAVYQDAPRSRTCGGHALEHALAGRMRRAVQGVVPVTRTRSRENEALELQQRCAAAARGKVMGDRAIEAVATLRDTDALPLV